MRATTLLLFTSLVLAGCNRAPPGPENKAQQLSREDELQEHEEARRLAQTQQNDAGEVAGSPVEVPEGPEYLEPGPAPEVIPPTTRPGVPGGAPVADGTGSATGVVVRATENQVVVRTPGGDVLPLMVDDDSRIRRGGQDVQASDLSPGTEVRASFDARTGSLLLRSLEARDR